MYRESTSLLTFFLDFNKLLFFDEKRKVSIEKVLCIWNSFEDNIQGQSKTISKDNFICCIRVTAPQKEEFFFFKFSTALQTCEVSLKSIFLVKADANRINTVRSIWERYGSIVRVTKNHRKLRVFESAVIKKKNKKNNEKKPGNRPTILWWNAIS